MKIIFLFGFGVVLGFFLNTFVKDITLATDVSEQVRSNSISTPHVENISSPVKGFTQLDQIKILEKENFELRAEINEYKRQVTADKHLGSNSNNLSENKIKASALREFNALQTATELTKYLASSGSDYPRDMENNFKSEVVDFSWAGSNEEKISTLFRNNPTLDDFVPELVECRSTRCQIRINVASNEDANELVELFSKALINNKVELAATNVMSAPDLSKGFLNLYIGRDADSRIFKY